jgi:hypothetical protein
VTKFLSAFLAVAFLTHLALAEETSFNRVNVPDPKGNQRKAILTFSDNDKAIEIRPAKGTGVDIPYAQIDRFSYEFTRKHRIKQGAIVLPAAIAPGAIIMMTRSKSHWLEIDYFDQQIPKACVVRMDKRDYLHILDAVKAHTGKDAQILGNANTRTK